MSSLGSAEGGLTSRPLGRGLSRHRDRQSGGLQRWDPGSRRRYGRFLAGWLCS